MRQHAASVICTYLCAVLIKSSPDFTNNCMAYARDLHSKGYRIHIYSGIESQYHTSSICQSIKERASNPNAQAAQNSNQHFLLKLFFLDSLVVLFFPSMMHVSKSICFCSIQYMIRNNLDLLQLLMIWACRFPM